MSEAATSTTIHDVFRFELDLNDRQRTRCVRSAGVARYAWKWGLRERIDRFERNEGKDRFISGYSQASEWVKVKPTWAYEVSLWAIDQRAAGPRRRFPLLLAPPKHDALSDLCGQRRGIAAIGLVVLWAVAHADGGICWLTTSSVRRS